VKINEMIYSLRKENNLSQEELADKLNVSRQTVSKWELGESSPDFNKIVPLCDVFGITTEELLRGKKVECDSASNECDNKPDIIKALLICSAIFLYFLALVSVILCEEFFRFNDGVVVSLFLILCGFATSIIIFTCMTRPGKKEKKVKIKNPILKGIIGIVSLIFTCIYLLVSFFTMAWHITWIIWIIYSLIIRIIQLVFYLKEVNDEE